ncbi:MAG: glycosyltransferase family 4 protein [Pseudomonadota bacterium]|nr:glycosyltransferase family 4 protein [Pseudomonadota bacterium]
MKIALLVDVYIPVAQAAAVMMHDLAKEIQSRGHDVTVITPTASISSPWTAENIEGITVVRVKTPDFKNIKRSSSNPVARKLANIKRGFIEGRLSSFMWQNAEDYFKDNKSDLIVYYAPTIFFGELIQKLKSLWRAPSYMIIRDIFPQWLVDAGEISPLHPGLWYMRHKEKINYKAADTIGIQSPANKDYFIENGYDHGKKFDVVFNWTDSDRFTPATGKWRKELGFKETDVIFFFGGAFTEAQDMPNLLRLAKNLSDTPNAKFLFVGKGAKYNEVETIINTQKLTNVTLRPAVDHKTFLEIMADIDVGLITLRQNLGTHNVPGKLLDYIVFGKPVLASLNTGNDLSGILNDSGAGFAFENSKDSALADAARKLTTDQNLRHKAGQKGLELQKKQFSVSRAADQILKHIDKA